MPLAGLKVEVLYLQIDEALSAARVVDPELRLVDIVGPRLLDQVRLTLD